MKKTVNVAIGGRSFIIDEDAYNALGKYLDDFRKGLDNSKDGSASAAPEVMEELEMRIADLFREKLNGREVVDIAIVDNVVAQLGMPDWKCEESHTGNDCGTRTTTKKFFRDTDDKVIGGVCSGLALYLNIDVVIVRILFFVALIFGTAGFWIYIFICIIAPAARTAAEKCELRGIPATAENIRRFSNGK